MNRTDNVIVFLSADHVITSYEVIHGSDGFRCLCSYVHSTLDLLPYQSLNQLRRLNIMRGLLLTCIVRCNCPVKFQKSYSCPHHNNSFPFMTSSTTSVLNILAHEVDLFLMAPGAVIYPPMTPPGTQPAQGQRCILILYSPFNFILQQNAAFQDLKLYVCHNVRSSFSIMEVRMAVCGWFARRNGSISVRMINCTHQANMRQISLRLVNHLHDFLIKSTFEATMEEHRVETLDEARLSLPKVPAQNSVTISRKRKLPFPIIRTRADCLQIQRQLMASSQSKQTIKYDNGRRHLPGQRPLLKTVNLLTDLRFLDTAPDLLKVA